MSVVNPEPRAAPATGSAFAYHRTSRIALWFGNGRGQRLFLALAAGLVGQWITGWRGGLVFPLTPAVSLCSGLLFGWSGIAGAAAGQLAAVWFHSGPGTALISSAAFSLTGIAGWVLFRHAPKLGRGIPNLRSFFATLVAALAGGVAGALLTSLLRVPAGAGQSPEMWIWTWVTGALVSVALLAPPILLAFDRFGRRWRVTLPHELLVREQLSLSLEERAVPATGEETLILAAPEPVASNHLRDLLLGTVMVLAAALVALAVVWRLPRGNGWTSLLYLLPILWAALRHGLRGGILAASASPSR